MPTDVITFALFNADGTPKTDAAPTFPAYVDRAGFARPIIPAISHVAGGEYAFTASSDDVAEGVAWVVDAGAGAFPALLSGGIFEDTRPFAVMLLTDSSGALWNSVPPTVGVYLDAVGNVRTPPAVVLAGSKYLYTLTPTRADLAVGVIFRLDAPALAYPSYASGEFDAQTPATPVGPGSPPQTNAAIAFNAAAYLRQLKALLPPGKAFSLETDSEVSRALAAYAEELARIDARSVQLIEESDPRTANETIEQWEAMLSLPDEQVLAIPGTLAGRRLAVTQKYTNRGGQNAAFFVRLAAACGYSLVAGSLPTPAAPVVTSFSGTGGSIGTGTKSYRVTALNRAGETLASAVGSFTVLFGGTNQLNVTWPRVTGAKSYRVYGRTGSQTYMTEIIDTGASTYTFLDTGAIAPTGLAVPGANTATYLPIEIFGGNPLFRVADRVRDRCYDAAFAYSMLVHAQTPAGTAMAQADFERVIRHVTHAHVVAWFLYHP